MRRIRSLAAVVVALCLGLTTWTHGQATTPTIRVAIGAPLTGGAASFGVEMKQAVELAVEEQKMVGGLRLETVVVDDEASNAKAQTVARAFCDDPTVLGEIGRAHV